MKDETNEKIYNEVDEYDLYEREKISLDEKERRKYVFEIEQKNIYNIKILNGMNCIHKNEVNKNLNEIYYIIY